VSARLTKAQKRALLILQPGAAVATGRETREAQINGRVAWALYDLGYVIMVGQHSWAITYEGALAIGDPDAVQIDRSRPALAALEGGGM
jgi:hypothetical protein